MGRVTGLSVTGSAGDDGAGDGDADGVGGSPVVVCGYEYDVDARLVGVSNSSGKSFRYGYDVAGRLVSLTDREGVGYFYRYDAAGRVIAAVGTHGMLANAFVYSADCGGDAPAGGGVVVMVETATELAVGEGDTRVQERLDRLVSLPLVEALRAGGVVAAGLGSGGRAGVADRDNPVDWATDPAVDAVLVADDALVGQVRPWVYRHTMEGDVWRVISPQGAVTDYVRDRRHALVSWTRPDGSRLGYTMDEFGCVTATELPDGGVLRTEFGGWGVPARQIDAAGRVTEVEIDAVGTVAAVTDPGGARTSYGWDVRASGAVLSRIVDARGGVTDIECDDAGRVVRTIDAAGRVWTITRNVFGDPVAVMDPGGQVTRRDWTPEGWLRAEHFPDGTDRHYTYDGEGHQTVVVDEAGNQTRTDYVAYGHARSHTDAQGGVLTQRFSTVFDPMVITNPDGLSWSFVYDRDSRVVVETDYNQSRTEFVLDTMGRAVATTDGLGRTISRVFDVAGRLIEEHADTDGSTVFGYNAAGELVDVLATPEN